MQLAGRGHPAIRATHPKTLEFTADADITERATCVVTVAARPEPAQPLAGPISITISAGDERFRLTALANPTWDPAGPAVVRRSGRRLPGTLATHADAGAADLPRALVSALRSEQARVEIHIDPLPSDEATVVLFALDPSRRDDPRLRAELAVADAVVAEDELAHTLLRGAGRGRAEQSAGGRVLVVATGDLPGVTVTDRLAQARVETVGLPPPLAVAAASASRAPLTFLDGAAGPLNGLAATPLAHRVVVRTDADALAAVLERAVEVRAASHVVVAQEFGLPVRLDIDLPLDQAVIRRDLVGGEPIWCCVEPAADGRLRVDPAVNAAMRALLTDGVPTRSIARVVSELTGLSKREAYDLVLAARTG